MKIAETRDINLVGIYRHPEHGKAHVWQKHTGGYNYEVTYVTRKGETKPSTQHNTSYDEVDKHLRSKGFKSYQESVEEETLAENTIKDAVWKAWKADEFMAPSEKHHSELKGNSKQEFDRHVSDVEKHAKEHNITHPMKAVISYSDHLIKKHFAKESLDEARRKPVGDRILRDIKQNEYRASGKFTKDLKKHNDTEAEKKWRESPDFHAAAFLYKRSKKVEESASEKNAADRDIHNMRQDYDKKEPPGSKEREARRERIKKAWEKPGVIDKTYLQNTSKIRQMAADIMRKRLAKERGE